MKLFSELDTNSDGVISKEELLEGYCKMMQIEKIPGENKAKESLGQDNEEDKQNLNDGNS